MGFAELGDTRLHYEWAGPENAPALLYSNSLGATYRMWDSQVEEFTKYFRVLRYDARGHGKSSVPPGPYSIAQLGLDVVQLLDHLGLHRVCFCGLSVGGMTGMYLGANAANRFHKIVLCNTAAKIGTAESWNARIEAVRKGGMKSVAAGVVERWFTPGYRSTHPDEVAIAQRMVEGCPVEGYTACCAAIRDTDHTLVLGTIHVPVLVVAGKNDPVTTVADGRFLAEHIPGANYTDLNAAHLSNIEAKESFNREVLQFLRG